MLRVFMFLDNGVEGTRELRVTLQMMDLYYPPFWTESPPLWQENRARSYMNTQTHLENEPVGLLGNGRLGLIILLKGISNQIEGMFLGIVSV